jgi:hypothetical protein
LLAGFSRAAQRHHISASCARSIRRGNGLDAFDCDAFRVLPQTGIQEILGGRCLPTDVDAEFGAEAAFVLELFVGGAVFVDEFGDFDVVTAVFGDIEETARAEPFDGLKAFGGFFDAEGGGGDGIEGEAVINDLLQLDKHVERGHLAKIEDGVAVEDFVIETKVVEADDEVGAHEFVDEVVDLLFAVDFVIAARGAVGDADAHAHVADVIPATHFVGRLLGFQIEIDNIFGSGEPIDHGARLEENERAMAMVFGGRLFTGCSRRGCG